MDRSEIQWERSTWNTKEVSIRPERSSNWVEKEESSLIDRFSTVVLFLPSKTWSFVHIFLILKKSHILWSDQIENVFMCYSLQLVIEILLQPWIWQLLQRRKFSIWSFIISSDNISDHLVLSTRTSITASIVWIVLSFRVCILRENEDTSCKWILILFLDNSSLKVIAVLEMEIKGSKFPSIMQSDILMPSRDEGKVYWKLKERKSASSSGGSCTVHWSFVCTICPGSKLPAIYYKLLPKYTDFLLLYSNYFTT